MSFSSSDSGALEKFLEKILEQREGVDMELDSAALRSLAEKYGLDGDAYDQLVREAEDHRARGFLFFEHGNWDDAITELDQAYVILPHDNELGFVLGKAHAREFKERRADSDRLAAEKYFRQCLKRDSSHAEAVRELTELERLADEFARSSGGTKPVLIAVVIVFAIGGLYFFLAPEKESTPPPKEVVNAPEEKQVKEDEAQAAPRGPVAIPVEFPVAGIGDDFSFDARSSVLTRYDGKYSYELLATILAGPVTISEMRAKLELLGEDETVFAEHEFDILASHRSAVLAGDSIPFRVLIFKPESAPDIVEARLTMKLFDHRPFPGEAEAGKLLELTGSGVALPPDYGFELRERNALRSKGGLSDEGMAHLKLILTLENTGKRQIGLLKFKASVSGEDGEVIPLGYNSITKHFSSRIKAGEISAVNNVQPPLLPGERRVIEASIYMPDTSPGDVAGYRLELLGIE
ncbi:hypothetical protein VSU19_21365 [Verrucomicrobiales bacterium BCK34]|nr:hypothetical protein [Verrucomicrobiales bacterium BCK34]